MSVVHLFDGLFMVKVAFAQWTISYLSQEQWVTISEEQYKNCVRQYSNS